MTDRLEKPNEETHTFLKSSLQLLAALVTGAFNSLAFLLFLAPPITLWLAWKHPYIVLPPAVAYYFLRYAQQPAVVPTIYPLVPLAVGIARRDCAICTPCGSEEHTSCVVVAIRIAVWRKILYFETRMMNVSYERYVG